MGSITKSFYPNLHSFLGILEKLSENYQHPLFFDRKYLPKIVLYAVIMTNIVLANLI